MIVADVAVVIITFNRVDEVLRTVGRICALEEAARVVVVDNASIDGTATALRNAFPRVLVIRLEANLGAAARNIGIAAAGTPYVALCDDDTWWTPGSLRAAARLLDANPGIAIVCAQVIVEPGARVDPASVVMARSPLPSGGLPGRAVLGFLAGATILRRAALTGTGGFDPRYFIGGEEEKLAWDLRARGWRIVYVAAIQVKHAPSRLRDGACFT